MDQLDHPQPGRIDRYRGSVWVLLFLDASHRIRRPVEYDYCARHGGLRESIVRVLGGELTPDQIVYLLYLVIGEGKTIPVLSIVLLAAIYGLQALIFIFRLRWDMIAWMICELLVTARWARADMS